MYIPSLPLYYALTVKRLRKASLYNLVTVRALHAHADHRMMILCVEKLEKQGLLTLDNFFAVINHKTPLDFITALMVLRDRKILNAVYRFNLERNATPYELARCIVSFVDKKMSVSHLLLHAQSKNPDISSFTAILMNARKWGYLTQETIVSLEQHKNLRDLRLTLQLTDTFINPTIFQMLVQSDRALVIARALMTLQENNGLSENNIQMAIHHSHPESMATAIITLAACRFILYFNADFYYTYLKNAANPAVMASIFEMLYSSSPGLLSDNTEKLLHYPQKDLLSLRDALVILQKYAAFKHEYITDILNHSQPISNATITACLSACDLLNLPNKEKIASLPPENRSGIAEILEMLWTHQHTDHFKLTQDELISIIKNRHISLIAGILKILHAHHLFKPNLFFNFSLLSDIALRLALKLLHVASDERILDNKFYLDLSIWLANPYFPTIDKVEKLIWLFYLAEIKSIDEKRNFFKNAFAKSLGFIRVATYLATHKVLYPPYISILMSHSDFFLLEKSLTLLTLNNILQPYLVEVILNSDYPLIDANLIVELNNLGYLTPFFLESCLQYPNKNELLGFLLNIFPHMLCADSLKSCLKNGRIHEWLFFLKKYKNTLDQKTFYAIAIDVISPLAFSAINILQDNNLLTPENITWVANHPNPGVLATTFAARHPELRTQQLLSSIALQQNPAACLRAISTLKQHHLFSGEFLQGTRCQDELPQAILTLSDANLLSDYYALVKNHLFPNSLALTIVGLGNKRMSYARILSRFSHPLDLLPELTNATDEKVGFTLRIFIAHPHPEVFLKAHRALKKTKIATQENEAILQDATIFTPSALELVSKLASMGKLNQAIFDLLKSMRNSEFFDAYLFLLSKHATDRISMEELSHHDAQLSLAKIISILSDKGFEQFKKRAWRAIELHALCETLDLIIPLSIHTFSFEILFSYVQLSFLNSELELLKQASLLTVTHVIKLLQITNPTGYAKTIIFLTSEKLISQADFLLYQQEDYERLFTILAQLKQHSLLTLYTLTAIKNHPMEMMAYAEHLVEVAAKMPLYQPCFFQPLRRSVEIGKIVAAEEEVQMRDMNWGV